MPGARDGNRENKEDDNEQTESFELLRGRMRCRAANPASVHLRHDNIVAGAVMESS